MGNVDSKESYQTILDGIFKSSIAIKGGAAKEAKELLKYVVDGLFIPELLKNDQFKRLYDHTYYTGSFFDGLRVSDAKEFDVNIVFKMPAQSKYSHSSPGHAKMYILNDDGILSRGKLSTEKIKRWFEGLIDKTWVKTLNRRCTMNNQSYIIKRSKSGPASTIKIYSEYNNSLEFDLDLAPVFQALKDCFLVPKPSEDDEYEWRLSYPHRERKLLGGKNIVKKAIKILKYLRDREGWHILSSYYIKTVAMHCLNGSNEENDLVLFLKESVELLLEYLDNGKIPFYHDHRYNLLQKARSATLNNVHDRLARILRKMKENPNDLYTYLPIPNIMHAAGPPQTIPMVSTESRVQAHSSFVDDVDSDEELEEISDHPRVQPRSLIPHSVRRREQGLTTGKKIVVAAGVSAGFGLVGHGLSRRDEDSEETKTMKNVTLLLGATFLAGAALYAALKNE